MTRCWLSEHHLAITTEGKVLPCTRYKKRHDAPTIHEQKINDIYNGEWINEIRYNLQQGEKLEACRKCWQQEEAGIPSMRQEYTGEWTNKLQSIEIAFSNHCNYACRHCNSFSSSKWYEDDLLLERKVPQKKLVDFDLSKLDNIKNITYFKFLGGEPLLNKSHNDFLQTIKNVDNVTLEYTTNGSIYPKKEIIDIWKRAKLVKLSVSLDDIHEGFNYFRTGGNFDTVVKNCKKFETLGIECRFHIVLNALNLHRMPLILDYIRNTFPKWYVFFDKVNLPEYLKTSQWSKTEGDKIISQVTNPRLKKLIAQECVNEKTNLKKLFDINSILDSRRNTNMFKVYPILNNF